MHAMNTSKVSDPATKAAKIEEAIKKITPIDTDISKVTNNMLGDKIIYTPDPSKLEQVTGDVDDAQIKAILDAIDALNFGATPSDYNEAKEALATVTAKASLLKALTNANIKKALNAAVASWKQQNVGIATLDTVPKF